LSLLVPLLIAAVIFYLIKRQKAPRLGAGTPSPTRAEGLLGELQASVGAAVQEALAKAGVDAEEIGLGALVGATVGADPAPGTSQPREALRIADVVSLIWFAGTRTATLAIDLLGQPARRIVLTVANDAPLWEGGRVYLIEDERDPTQTRLAPAALSKDQQSLIHGANRLDPLVLGPQLLAFGAKGKAVVRSAESVEIGYKDSAARDTLAKLDLDVTPERGFPYRTAITLTLSAATKPLAQPGAIIPIRYDPTRPSTLALDAGALGITTPAEALPAPFDIATLHDLARLRAKASGPAHQIIKTMWGRGICSPQKAGAAPTS
jgi:hypothetical protein